MPENLLDRYAESEPSYSMVPVAAAFASSLLKGGKGRIGKNYEYIAK